MPKYKHRPPEQLDLVHKKHWYERTAHPFFWSLMNHHNKSKILGEYCFSLKPQAAVQKVMKVTTIRQHIFYTDDSTPWMITRPVKENGHLAMFQTSDDFRRFLNSRVSGTMPLAYLYYLTDVYNAEAERLKLTPRNDFVFMHTKDLIKNKGIYPPPSTVLTTQEAHDLVRLYLDTDTVDVKWKHVIYNTNFTDVVDEDVRTKCYALLNARKEVYGLLLRWRMTAVFKAVGKHEFTVTEERISAALKNAIIDRVNKQ